MKCHNCHEEWVVPAGRSHSFCPACGKKLSFAGTTGGIDSAEAALRYIAEHFGTSELLGSRIVSLFADVAHNQLKDERDLIKILADRGALDCLKAGLGEAASEQEVAIKRAISKLPSFLRSSADVEAMLRSFTAALGWEMAEPVFERGNIVPFGGYTWRVLDLQEGKALLLCEKVIEQRAYNSSGGEAKKGNTWAECGLRDYLNSSFYNSLGQDKTQVAEMLVVNYDNLWYGTAGGEDTSDRIFLLSIEEADRYFGDSEDYLNKRRKEYK
jgi:hypothetical protein